MKEHVSELATQLSLSLEVELPEGNSADQLKALIADHINYLISHDFDKLLRLLYKVDVSEKQLKKNLLEHKEDAGALIAQMIIERQLQKIKTRKEFKANGDIPDVEKW